MPPLGGEGSAQKITQTQNQGLAEKAALLFLPQKADFFVFCPKLKRLWVFLEGLRPSLIASFSNTTTHVSKTT
jgi:hypothetical protein